MILMTILKNFFMPPLKRKKMGHESIKNSQVTYSSVQSQIYPKRSSRNQSQNKRNLSQTSKNSKLKKNNQHIKVNNKPQVLFKEPVNIRTYFKSNQSQNTKLTSRKTESSKKKLNNAKYDTPDIDFTQINDIDSSHFFDSKGQSSSDTLNEKEDLDEEKFFCDKELVIQEDCNKVDSWLHKSIQENHISLKEEVANCDGDDIIQPTLEHFFKKSSTCSANAIKSEEAKLK
ncbi:hypothetical protein Anas_13530, partial [Armadillidium nasatum]